MSLRVINPWTSELVCELPFDDAAAVERKLALVRRAQRDWCALPVEERCARVARCLGWFREHQEEVARDLTLQMGKPIAQARREVSTMLERAEHTLQIAPLALAPEHLPWKAGFQRRIEHVPLGVVLDLAAWNYPLLIAVNVVVPALLAGNTVLLKHSAKTPLCGQHFAGAFAALGEGLVQSLLLTHADTARLIADPRIGYTAFTGSVEGGREVYRAASARLLDVGLELGGKCPAYAAEDCDLDFTADNLVDGACYNAGQSCCAVERAYVHRSRYDAFVKKARGFLEQYVLGDPLDEKTTLGPMATRDAVAFLQRQVDDATRRGARVLCGGKPAQDGRCFLPTLLVDVPQDAAVMQEETFGPLLPVRAVRDDDEALALMNDSRYGLTASVWTRDRGRAERFVHELEAGTVYQNRCDYLDPGLPWTGVKESGMGATLSRWGFYCLTRRKSVHLRER